MGILAQKIPSFSAKLMQANRNIMKQLLVLIGNPNEPTVNNALSVIALLGRESEEARRDALEDVEFPKRLARIFGGQMTEGSLVFIHYFSKSWIPATKAQAVLAATILSERVPAFGDALWKVSPVFHANIASFFSLKRRTKCLRFSLGDC